LKKFTYNKVDSVIKELIIFITTLLFFLFTSTLLVAQEISHKAIISEGRAVIVDGNEEVAKKRALDDALYLASLQGGAKIDGYSTVDTNTSLNENLLIRPSSSIKDFVILEESKDETHYSVKIKAILVSLNSLLDCSARSNINLSYFKPNFVVSSKLPAQLQNLPLLISQKIFENLTRFDQISLKDSTNFDFNPKKFSTLPVSLDYEAIVEGKSGSLKSGEFGIHTLIEVKRSKGTMTRFLNKADIALTINLFEGTNFNVIDTLNYNFSVLLGIETGYQHMDGFYKIPYDKIAEVVQDSISKMQFRVKDRLKCYPLEARAELVKDVLTIPLGINQGVQIGKVGFASNSNPNHSMRDWIVVTVKDSSGDFSVLEILNPSNKKEDINGKLIRFMN
jgi:hypothetical protein|tara:strand:+ start:145 stop:1323 length:1179 start_codon:yes stop_codon:yes gene_type:complete